MFTLTIKLGLDVMVDEVKDRLIAPKISQLESPQIPDISEKRTYPLNAFIFNFDLSMVVSNKNRQLLFNIIRKIGDAFDEYCFGTISLKNYVESDRKSITPYFAAVRHFEHCLAHIYQAVLCMNRFAKDYSEEKQFEKDDGSVLDRISTIHNEVKHMDNKFENSSTCDEMSYITFSKEINNFEATNTSSIPMWLTEQGIECQKGSVSYVELSQEILELLDQAKKLSSTKPENKRFCTINKQDSTS